MDPDYLPPSVFAILTPANKAAKDSFDRVANKKLDDMDWNPTARQNIAAHKKAIQVLSTYSTASESDGGTGPSGGLFPVLAGYYTFNFSVPPRQPDKGWLIGGGKFSGGDESPEILLTERKKYDSVSSRHARLSHNFASGALVITASDNNVVIINGHEVVDKKCVIHGNTTSLEFGQLKYRLEVRQYGKDAEFREQLTLYKQNHAIADDDYPSNLLATPADSDLVTQNYVMKNPVGDGATSVVYAAINKRDGQAVAIKKIRRNKRNAIAIQRDIQIGKYIGEHWRICSLIEVIDPAATDPKRGYKMFGFDEVFLVYTPLANYTIQKLIEHNILLDDETREEIFWQLLEGIEFLHSLEVMHRDIKPANMTVVSMNPAHPQARLIDFGMATIGLNSREYHVGTQQYAAPEMLAGWDNRTNDPYDERVDMFAFGISMYQFFCQRFCDWERIDMDRKKDINASNLTNIHFRLFESSMREELLAVLFSMISWEPERRPTARRALGLRFRDESARNRDEEERARTDAEGDEIQDFLSHDMASLNVISHSGPIDSEYPQQDGKGKGKTSHLLGGGGTQMLNPTAKTFYPRGRSRHD